MSQKQNIQNRSISTRNADSTSFLASVNQQKSGKGLTHTANSKGIEVETNCETDGNPQISSYQVPASKIRPGN